jgi:hypothetical protein
MQGIYGPGVGAEATRLAWHRGLQEQGNDGLETARRPPDYDKFLDLIASIDRAKRRTDKTLVWSPRTKQTIGKDSTRASRAI